MDAQEFETGTPRSPSSFNWGFISINDLPHVRARVRCYTENDNIAGVSIFGLDENNIDDTSLIYLRMYRLPAADKAFADDLKSFANNAKPIDPQSLAIPNLPSHWRHKSVSSDAGIVHAWRGGT